MPIINGDDQDNDLEDTSGDDVINGNGGSDRITVKNGGVDYVDGGNGGIDRLILDYRGRGPITMSQPGFSSPGGTTDRSGQVYENAILILTYDRINRIYVTGSSGDDVLYGVIDFVLQPGANSDGADILDGGAGADVMHGDRGNDTYYVDNAGDVVDEPFERFSVDTVYTSLTTYFVPWNVDRIFTTTSDSYTIYGNAEVHSGGGNDLLISLAQGSEDLGGHDYYGGAGSDTYVRPRGIIELAGEGWDLVYADSFTLAAGSSVEVITTPDQDSTAKKVLAGNELDQWIYGGAGADELTGGGGRDILIGRQGNDLYKVGSFITLIYENVGEGNDRALVQAVEYVLNEGASVETLASDFQNSTAIQNLWGNSFGNILTGTQGANVLDGQGGVDTMRGFGGGDIYFVDNVADVVVEESSQGFDTVYVTASSYTLAAGNGVEVLSVSNHGFTTAIDLFANELDNYVYGNAGANLLDGGAGIDRMIGFGGADTFRFSTAPSATNFDLIADFEHGVDRIQLGSSAFAGLSPGALSPDAFNTGAAASDGSDRIVYNSATGALIFDTDGAGGADGTVFAYLSTGLNITASDFMVI